MIEMAGVAAVMAMGLLMNNFFRQAEQNRLLCFCAEDDSDVKIAPKYPSRSIGGDAGDAVARDFVKNKGNGNIEKAHLLGEELARAIVNERGVVRFGFTAEEPRIDLSQRQILLGFTTTKLIEILSPNSIVAQKALSTFYDTVQSLSPETYELISDSAAFSMYILCDRTRDNESHCFGAVFAKLCGKPEDALYTLYGRELFHYFYHMCAETIKAAQFV